MKAGTVTAQVSGEAWGKARIRAFTLVELLIASTVLLLVALALVSSNISGARISQLVQQQTDGQREERRVTMLLKRDIAEARRVEIGQGTIGLIDVPTNGFIKGNAMRLIYDDPSVVSRNYFVENGTLRSSLNDGTPDVVLEDVSNDVVSNPPFSLVDPGSLVPGLSGLQLMTNDAGRALVRVRFQLSTLGGQSFVAGPNATFQGNEIEFFASQRVN